MKPFIFPLLLFLLVTSLSLADLEFPPSYASADSGSATKRSPTNLQSGPGWSASVNWDTPRRFHEVVDFRYQPSWSADGSRIAFWHEGSIFVASSDGSWLTTAVRPYSSVNGYEVFGWWTEQYAFPYSPAISPDGAQVAYVQNSGPSEINFDIFVSKFDGSNRHRLTTDRSIDTNPVWSPDGTRIAFMSSRDSDDFADFQIFTMNADGSDIRKVSGPAVPAKIPRLRSGRSYRFRVGNDPVWQLPVWSPDSRRLAFAAEIGEPKYPTYLESPSDPGSLVRVTTRFVVPRHVIYVVNADGSGLQMVWDGTICLGFDPRIRDELRHIRLEVPEESMGQLLWSPKGGRLAFVAKVYGEPEKLYVLNLDATDSGQVTRPCGSEDELLSLLAWLPWLPESLATSLTFNPGQVAESHDDENGRLTVLPWLPDGSALRFASNSETPDENDVRREIYHAAIEDLATRSMSENTVPGRATWLHYYSPSAAYLSRTAMYVNLEQDDPSGTVLVKMGLDWADQTLLVRDLGDHLTAANPPWLFEPDDPALCSNGTAVPDPERNPGLVHDCVTLLAVEKTLAGDAPLYWSVDVPMMEWGGITLGGSPLRVHAIEPVHDVKLNGTIPSGLSGLTELRRLDLPTNALSGSIPPDLGNLANLEYLDLSDQASNGGSLSGSIPPQLGNLQQLKYMDLSRNRLSGPIPPQLANLENLQELHLFRNRLYGMIPPELSSLTNLVILNLWENQISGPIPSELAGLRNLEELGLGSNRLYGRIPPELGNLSNLEILSLSRNQFSGAIPPEFAGLPRLRELYLDHNELTGAVPEEFANFARKTSETSWSFSLRALYLNSNSLTGCVPEGLTRMWRANLGGLRSCPLD